LEQVSASRTSVSLLQKLRRNPTDQAAWRDFVQRYGPCIFRWCRQWHLQEADAQDVTQNVLIILAREMQTFAYDPALRFRGWLKTVTHHAWSRFVSRQQRACVGSGDDAVLEWLRTVEARDDLVQQLAETFDGELLQEAMARVRARVAPPTWEAFRLTALDGVSGAEAAGQLNLKVATVFVARGRVQKMLREEIARLEEESPA
jgi:RNA polymerase sigma-70 factor (ECF subfamily)